MKPEEFVKNFYLQKQNILNSAFTSNLEFKSYVASKIENLNLNESETQNLRNILNVILTDAYYSILLGLDGAASIGEAKQQVFSIYDEENNLISECGELEGYAYDYFHANKFETEKSNCDFIAELHFNTNRTTPTSSGYRPHLVFNFDDYQTSGRQKYLGTDYAFPGDVVNAEIDLLSSDYFNNKLKENMGFKFYEGQNQIGTGRIVEIKNQKLKKDS